MSTFPEGKLLFITGGSGSGKSAFAEQQVVDSGIARRIYLATMQAFGEEGRARVERHRALRAGKGFETVERTAGLASLSLPTGCAVLLEDLTNLFANEWFSVAPDGAAERVLEGVVHLTRQAALTVVVGNDLFRDGVEYADRDTAAYLAALASLNNALCAKAQGVWEVVCGIPICLRKEGRA